MAIVNERIRQRRQQLGLTLAQVAEKLTIKEATMQRYESGEIKNIKHETITGLAEILQCSPSYLMGWSSSLLSREDLIEVKEGVFVSSRDYADHTDTLAAHFDGEEYTEDELTEIRKFAEFVKSRRNI